MKQFILLISFLFTYALIGQNFEGQITFRNSFKSKNPKMTDEQWMKMMGSTQEYFIKEGQYKSKTNGSMFEWQVYSKKENKIYSKPGNSDTILWNDASIYDDIIIKSEVKRNVLTILGYSCDELILTCKSGVQKYYFAPKLAVNFKLFENHKYGNWFDFLKVSKSLSLKTVIETSLFTMETIATEIKPMKIDDKIFALPANAKTSKSPY